MDKQFDSLKLNESTPKHLSKTQKFVENTKRAVRNALTTTWIVAASMWPITAPSVIPVSANTITRIEPITSTNINKVWQWTTFDLFAAFNEKNNKNSEIDIPTDNQTETTSDAKQSETDLTRWENWTTAELEANNSSINSSEYKAIEIENINPEDLMPKVEVWDKDVYKHIEHLRIPESTVITDMMWKYGAGNYSPEEYQQLMNRLNTWMIGEYPKWYNNFEIIGQWSFWDEWIDHSHIERSILNFIIKHSNFKVVFTSWEEWQNKLETFIGNNQDMIIILWSSSYAETDKEHFEQRSENNKVRDLCKSGKLIIFKSGWNIYEESWILKNKSYQRDINWDEHWIYSLQANANWKIDNNADISLLVTVWTNADWNIDQTNEIYASSMFPVWFHDKVLFSGRAFPYHSLNSWKIEAEGNTNNGKYATSFTNYLNVAIADLCFQMKADVADVDELLEMIRSTALTDYIRFDLNGDGDTDDTYQGQPETQPLQLMNPAWFFKEYLMPTSLPVNLKSNETTPLEKWYYHGVVYQIPGAEVNINGQWVPFTDDNEELIFSQNPMNLEWRLNGETLNNYNYKPGDTINGQIIAVDDQWNGLNITKDFSVNIEDTSDINSVAVPYSSDTWYTIDGIRLDSKPTKPGVYIMNGQKFIVK